MPAGNDASAAVSELADQFGEGVGQADQVVRAVRERYVGDLTEAQLAVRDDQATADLRENGLGDVAKTADLKEAQLLDVAVRGKFITYVYANEDGRTHKGVFRKDALGKSPKEAEKVAEKEQGSPAASTDNAPNADGEKNA